MLRQRSSAAAGHHTPWPAAPPVLWTGLDTPQRSHLLMVQFDATGEDLGACCRDVDALLRALRRLGVEPGFRRVPAGAGPGRPTALIGASVRFFKGERTPWRDDCEYSERWRRAVDCPPSLRTMRANRDDEFEAFRTEPARRAHESDFVLLVEADDATVAGDVLDAVHGQTGDAGLAVRRTHRGGLLPGGRDPFGFVDGISNLQDLRVSARARYDRHVFALDGDGEVEGTYLAFRRYRTYPDRLTDTIVIPGERGRDDRRLRRHEVVGRCPASGLVVHRDTGEPLEPAFDEGQAALAHPQSHVTMANPRGHGTTNFGNDVRVADVRILRRSYPYEVATDSGPETGLLFLAFQADIQYGGFEFIHNQWLLSDFNGGPDPLLDPRSGLVEPLTGCYYYIPREQAALGALLRERVEGPEQG